MRIIKLDATGSTNATLKELWQNDHALDWTILRTDHQTKGRGQQGTNWISEPGKNLTFSVLKIFKELNARHQFLLNLAVSLAVHDSLKKLEIPELYVKWPNDIMSGSYKICGILIENIVKSNNIQAAVIGIGVNINQEDFGAIEGAASLKTITGSEEDPDAVFALLIDALRGRLDSISYKDLSRLQAEYESVLFRKDIRSRFAIRGGEPQIGIIRGISEKGMLLVEIEGVTSEFGMKEIKFLSQMDG